MRGTHCPGQGGEEHRGGLGVKIQTRRAGPRSTGQCVVSELSVLESEEGEEC